MKAASRPRDILANALEFVRPSFVQVAAMCVRQGKDGPEVLLIQTLTRKLWMVPKGWPMDGLSLSDAAAQEAWEEAGVRGPIAQTPLGAFSYTKIKSSGLPVQCRAQVFRLDVTHQSDDYPEAKKRVRRWVRPEKAAEMVQNAQLARLLASL
ncbi:MAG: putative NTP pyrophosphohydrolase [Roseibaca calidilacus]|uniref:8-oxo-dGTP pyrophosphatase MutT, NUDIX family n=1 Tax=Roseibaca calidilacus TaxID=1666912 RepID=A0A0P7YR63_9RHOB|nr:NUDIX hydrolase [Roseibaca calidilacus]KPP91615.1 MAG: putative NTP pyrophosphohydrolase [Roseibaca calidilacus]CUX82820.1 8-oxo-dGTP pyrophosphatase MutT, NUDIX family [Roseibaca calidilacus]